MNTHRPLQPMYKDDNGTVRFVPNAIVDVLLKTGKLNLNDTSVLEFSDEDREQFAQLIGYSLKGFEELSYVRDETFEATWDKAVADGLIEEETK